MNHTPGPWDYDEIAKPFYNDAEGNSRGGDGSGFYEVFAHVEYEEDGEECADTIILVGRAARADARLMAASPDLLEALNLLYKLHAEGVFHLPDQHYRAITITAAAIAKAEEEVPV